MTERYPPIDSYALLSDCFSTALVTRDCEIDWACFKRFDASSVFGRLLDWDRGGYFGLSPRNLTSTERRYVEGTLVLETTVETATGRARVRDAFVMRPGGREAPAHRLARVIDGERGSVTFDVVIEPRFDYGYLRPWLRPHRGAGETSVFSAVGGDDCLVISTDADLRIDRDAFALRCTVTVDAGSRKWFCLESQVPHRLDPTPRQPREIDDGLADTITWWQRWSSGTRAAGRYADIVRRSVIVLKGLTCAPTGAIVAAATTSLPETIGGERNWDYRYSWVRDSSLTLAALYRAGHPEVAHGFFRFLLRSAAGSAEQVQIMYGVYGEHWLHEVELDLEGYRGSRPVRIGNGAAQQVQHDVYGHIIEMAELWLDGQELDDDIWRFLCGVVDTAAERWERPGHGIWEMRGEPRQFTHSKAMLWAALDRGIRLAERFGDRYADLERWHHERKRIHESVFEHGLSAGGWFTQTYGGDAVDASLLRLPMIGFVPARDERMVRTVDQIHERLSIGRRGFIRRYDTDRVSDGVSGHEGVFLMCSLWLAEVLVMQGRRAEARDLFERVLQTGNDLGLFSEEYDPETGELLGNFPQAFTHMALINVAFRLEAGS